MEPADSLLGLSRPSESPEAAEMLPVCDAGCSNSNNFGFAFDDINFSDKTLRIEIVPDLTEDSKTGDEGHDGISDSARYRKRRRIINGNDFEECVSYGNRDEEDVAMIEEGPAGVGLNANQIGRSTEGSDSSSSDPSTVLRVKIIHITSAILAAKSRFFCKLFSNGMKESEQRHVTLRIHESGRSTEGSDPSSSDPSTVLRVKIIHITSAILAANSRFFYKLFSNGMRESEQRHVTLRIHESEEAAFMDLLNFMYSNTLPRTSLPALLEVLMVADKYEVASCMNYCYRLMKNIPMTSESALLYLDLPSSVLMADAVQPLIVCAKQFLASRYKDYTKCIDEVLNLPLAGIEQVFSSSDLQTDSEDVVYDFLLKWAQTHYPKLEERKEIVSTRLVRLIRFPFMSCRKLKKVLTSPDFDGELASKSVLEALFFKEKPPHRQHILTGDKSKPLHHRFVSRTYRYRPVRWMEFDQPHQHCVVYLDLNHEECKDLYPAGRIYSQAFNLGGQGFCLSAHCQVDQLNSIHCFGLFLRKQEKGCTSSAVDYKFATRSKPMNVYISRCKGICTFTVGNSVGSKNLFGVTWEEFIAENSEHFISGVLHIRAELTIMK